MKASSLWPLRVCFLSFQHITNPRKAVGQQDLMINNPLSQDEGVKLVFIRASAALAHQSMLVSHYQSPWKQCCSTPVAWLFHPRVSPPKAGWALLPAVCWQLGADGAGEGRPRGCERSGSASREPRQEWEGRTREDSSPEGDRCAVTLEQGLRWWKRRGPPASGPSERERWYPSAALCRFSSSCVCAEGRFFVSHFLYKINISFSSYV